MPDQYLTETEMARSFLALEPIVISATGTVPRFHGARTELVDTAGGNITRTLPNALGSVMGSVLQIAKTAAANTLTITPATGQTINGSASSITITSQYATVTLWRNTDGTGWHIPLSITP